MYYISISLSSQVLYGSSRLGTMNYLSGQYGMSYHRVSYSQSVYTSTKLSTSDYYPFGSLMPGRTVMDTTVHCVDMTQIDRVWQPAYENGLLFNSLFSAMSPWGAASYELSSDYGQLDLFIEDEQSGIKLLLDSGIGSGSLMLEGKVSNITDRGIVLRVQGVDAEGNGVVYHQAHLGQFDGKMEIPLDSAYSDYVVNIQGLLQWSILGNTVVNGRWVETEVLVRVCDEAGDKYRFGFNGMEKDNEMKGLGNSLDFGARMYDSRVGRWLSVDPLAAKFSSMSPYSAMGNNPIFYIDPDGREIKGATKRDAKKFKVDIHIVLADKMFDEVRALIDVKGKTFKSIDAKVLSTALDGVTLNVYERTYIDMVTNTINSTDIHIVEYVSTNSDLSSSGFSALNSYLNGLQSGYGDALRKQRQGQDGSTEYFYNDETIEILGGEGFNVPTKKGSHSFITGVTGNERVSTSGHEVFGHGIPSATGASPSDNNANAIRTDNLIRRILGMPQRDGKDHGGYDQGHIADPQKLPRTQ